MAKQFEKSDTVFWNSGSGNAKGTIQEYITETKTVEGKTVSASENDPRYLVKNDNTDTITGHKPDTLFKADDRQSNEFQPGDKVEWNTAQGKTAGKVIKKLTSPTEIKGYTAKATEEDPQYLVKSEKTGARAAHKPDALSQA